MSLAMQGIKVQVKRGPARLCQVWRLEIGEHLLNYQLGKDFQTT